MALQITIPKFENQGANVSFDSSQLVSRASQGIEAVLTNIDLSLSVRMESGKHAKVDKRKNVYTIAHQVLDGKMTEYCPGRAYKAFPTMEREVLKRLNPSSLLGWIRTQKRKLENQEVELPDTPGSQAS